VCKHSACHGSLQQTLARAVIVALQLKESLFFSPNPPPPPRYIQSRPIKKSIPRFRAPFMRKWENKSLLKERLRIAVQSGRDGATASSIVSWVEFKWRTVAWFVGFLGHLTEPSNLLTLIVFINLFMACLKCLGCMYCAVRECLTF